MEITYTQQALDDLEKDIRYLSHKYHVPRYDAEDLAQELRLHLWVKLPKFDHQKGVTLRTWANMVMRNRLRNLLRDQTQPGRHNGLLEVTFDDSIAYRVEYYSEIELAEGLLITAGVYNS